MRLTKDEEADLVRLWGRRSTLTEPEWVRLHSHVTKELLSGRHSLISALPHESKDDLVSAFFLHKVFDTRHVGTRLDHAGALHDFFGKYLIDQRRQAGTKRLSYEAEPSVDSAGPAWDNEPLCGESAAEGLLPKARDRVATAAPALVASLPGDDLRYLLWQQCSDQGPLVAFAQRHGIGNYHAKALRLGITRKKGELHRGYEKTIVGQWLAGLGITPEPDNWDAICEAFDILCRAIRLQMTGSHAPA